jgi:uncharacterized membrane protein YvbJ
MPRSPDTDAHTRRRAIVVVAIAAVLLAVIIGIVAITRARSSPATRFCTLELVVSEDGKQQYHRDSSKDCQFVDQDGHPPPAR